VSLCVLVEACRLFVWQMKIFAMFHMMTGTVDWCINPSLHNQMYAFLYQKNCEKSAFTVFSFSILNFSFSYSIKVNLLKQKGCVQRMQNNCEPGCLL
jgi:hypothetical protein